HPAPPSTAIADLFFYLTRSKREQKITGKYLLCKRQNLSLRHLIRTRPKNTGIKYTVENIPTPPEKEKKHPSVKFLSLKA
ncbi:hypothetical protein, partial [Pseudomonas aeruginosa]|uniref:hypothetical protein n=1 Tax=Pseudomonas aeruginosa TaxID=287 RepID=UPI0031B6F5BE